MQLGQKSVGSRFRIEHLKWSGSELWLVFVAISWVGAFAGFIPLFKDSLLLNQYFPFDRWLMTLYALAVLLIGLLVQIRRGHLLFLVTATALASLVLALVVLGSAGPAILALSWITVISSGVGNRVLLVFARNLQMSVLERTAFATTIGYGVLGLMTLAVAVAHVLSPSVILAFLGALTVLVAGDIRYLAEQIANGAIRPTIALWRKKDDIRLPALAFAAISVCFVGSFLWALAPAVHADTLVDHLAVPQIYINHAGLVEVPEEASSYWAHNAEVLFTLALALVGQPLPTLIHLSFGLLTVAMIFGLGKRIASSRVGLLAAVLFSAIPVVSWEAGTAYIDLMVTLFVLGSLYSVTMWWREDDERWLTLAGCFGGFAIGTKLNSLLFLPPIAAFIIYSVFARRKTYRARSRALAFPAASAAFLSAPWFALEWFRTGNPVFPWFNSFFRSTKWWVDSGSVNNFDTFGVGHGIADLIKLPWDMTISGSAFGEGTVSGFAGLSLVSLPIAFFLTNGRLRKVVVGLTLFIGISTLLSFQTAQYFRYWLPYVPAMALLAAINVESSLLSAPVQGRRKGFLLLTAIIIGLAWLLATRWTSLSYNFYVQERYPYKLALGIESKEDFLLRAVRGYAALQYLARLNEREEPRVFGVGYDYRVYNGRTRIYKNQGSPLSVTIASMPPGESLARALEENEFSYILYDAARIRAAPGWRNLGIINNSFLKRYARLEFARSDVYVYRFLPSGAPDPKAQEANLLGNPSFERFDVPNNPEGWIIFGDPSVDASGQRSRTGAVAVEVSQDGGLFQPVVVRNGELYSFSAYIRAENTNQVAWLQVMWVDEKGIFLGGEIVHVPAITSWERQEISFTTPEQVSRAQVYARAAPGSRVWFDDIEFFEK